MRWWAKKVTAAVCAASMEGWTAIINGYPSYIGLMNENISPTDRRDPRDEGPAADGDSKGWLLPV